MSTGAQALPNHPAVSAVTGTRRVVMVRVRVPDAGVLSVLADRRTPSGRTPVCWNAHVSDDGGTVRVTCRMERPVTASRLRVRTQFTPTGGTPGVAIRSVTVTHPGRG